MSEPTDLERARWWRDGWARALGKAHVLDKLTHRVRVGEFMSVIRFSKSCDYIDEVQAEVARARGKFPDWPTDPVHAAAIVAEECGELQQAVLQVVYEPHKSTSVNVRIEAIQTAAMCLRFLASLDRYEWWRAAQHTQKG